MRIYNISKLGFLIGISIIAASYHRWFVLWNDVSQGMVGISIGIIICGFSYIYNWMKNNEGEIASINKRIDSFTKWLGKKELQ